MGKAMWVVGAVFAGAVAIAILAHSASEKPSGNSRSDLATPTPARQVSTAMDITSECVDAVGDLREGVGIDLASVRLAEEGAKLVVTYNMNSVTGLSGPNAVHYSSILQATDNASFGITLRNRNTEQWSDVTVWLNSAHRWRMTVIDSRKTVGAAEVPVYDGEFALSDGMTEVATIPIAVLPPPPWEWQAHVLYAYNKHDWCPGGNEEGGWLVMPQ